MGMVFYSGGIMRDGFETGKTDSSLLEYALAIWSEVRMTRNEVVAGRVDLITQ